MREEMPQNEGAVLARPHFGGEGLRVSTVSPLDANEEMSFLWGKRRPRLRRWSSPVLDGATLVGVLLSMAAISGLVELASRCEGTQSDNCKAVSDQKSTVRAVHLPQVSQATTKE